jgi:predicted  nucleic acid-binding Zn-ribbon protein
MWPFKKPSQFEGAAKPIMGNFNLTAQLPNGRGIQVSGYVFDGESIESLNGRMDLVQEAIERQRARAEIPELEAKREQMIGHMRGLKDSISEMEHRQREKHNLTSQEELNLRNHRTNITRINEEIEKGGEAIAVAKRKAGIGV